MARIIRTIWELKEVLGSAIFVAIFLFQPEILIIAAIAIVEVRNDAVELIRSLVAEW